MTLNLLRKVADKHKKKNTDLPSWVSKKNVTFDAYQCIKKLQLDRLRYISAHNKSSHFKAKKLYQISASEVARDIGCATTTLISTSAYSVCLKEYLVTVNKELDSEKNKKLSRHKRTLASGMKQRKKDELTKELQAVKKERDKLKKQNVEEQVLSVLNAISLPVKYKLGID